MLKQLHVASALPETASALCPVPRPTDFWKSCCIRQLSSPHFCNPQQDGKHFVYVLDLLGFGRKLTEREML